jgi:hypothetical protein
VAWSKKNKIAIDSNRPFYEQLKFSEELKKK